MRKVMGFVAITAGFTVGFLAAFAAPASAQLDPLLFIKDTAPFVLLAVDTSDRMQRDAPSNTTDLATSRATSAYYDPWEYATTGAMWESTLGIPAGTSKYRRKYYGLTYAGANAPTSSIRVVTPGPGPLTTFDTAPTPSPTGLATYSLFEAPTRLSLMRAAIYQAIVQNLNDVQFGLIKMRQSAPTATAAQGLTTPITGGANQGGTNQTETGAPGSWNLSRPKVAAANGAVAGPPLPVYLYDATTETSNNDIQAFLAKTAQNGGLIAAGAETATDADAPLNNLLLDARTEATRLIGGDASCTNTIVVLITGGGEGEGTRMLGADPAATALSFLNVQANRRVPIYVVAIAPPATDVANLKLVAARSGGQYFEITKKMIDDALASTMLYGARKADGTTVWPDTASPISGTVIVPEFVAAINVAIQHGFATPAAVNAPPDLSTTPAQPFGPFSEFQVSSPVIGTVNLERAKDIQGNALVNSLIYKVSDPNLPVIPQHSNVLLTTAFLAPGAAMTMPDGTITATSMNGALRAFRQYKPVVDATQPSGYKFSADGTRLWVACAPGPTPDGMRPCASTDSSKRNLYTAQADGTIIPFNVANVAVLAGLMGNLSVTDATNIINWVRNAPIGTMLDSTPALMNPPSLDPPPDPSYPAFVTANKNRRSMIWVGTNAGILEGIDARSGVEVWGFIPMNLLPKLKVLRLGQGLTTFEYTMDGSPKIADVRIPGLCAAGNPSDCWRTHLTIGEGAGGTFYQSFDVTLKGLGDLIPPDTDNLPALLTYFSDPGRITLNWAFPQYVDFDPTAAVFDANSDSTQLFGDLKASASAVEKTVGQTWSDPSIGQVASNDSPYAVLVGSGFLPWSMQQSASRAATVAGTTFYVLSAKDGTVYASSNVGSDGLSEAPVPPVLGVPGVGDDCSLLLNAGELKHQGKKKKLVACNTLKNALQSDPVTTGPTDSRFITKAYMGDLDGRVWRWDLDLDANTKLPVILARTKLYETGHDQPIFSSIATLNVGGANQYLFFGSGSDLLPSTDISTKYQLVDLLDKGAIGQVVFKQSLSKNPGKGTDEKVTASPAVAGDIVFFTTTTFKPANSCTNLQDANLYALRYLGGPAYDNTGDNQVTGADTPLVKSLAGQRATAPFIVDQHLVFGAGGTVAVFGDSTDYNNGVGQSALRILSWREVR